MRNALRAILFAILLFAPSAALAQCYSTVPLPPNTVLGRLGTASGPCQAIPFAQLSSQLTGASITLNSGNGQTAPGAMSGGNTYSFGATTDKVQMTGLGLGGSAPATGLEVYNAAVSPTGTGQGMVGGSSLNGGVLAGQGSVFDAALQNKAGSIALGVTTNTQNVVLNGTLTAGSLSTAGTIAGSLCATSAGLILYEAGVNCYAVSGISVASGKTLTIDNTLEFAGTDGTKFTFPSASDTVATLAANQTVTGNKTFSGTLNITGTGQLNGTAFGTFATQNYATPPAIGGITPNTGAFSTLTATTPIGLASGGTNASTAAGARASTGLNIDGLTSHGDSNYSILSTDRTVATSTTLTAARTWTLPAASSVNPGQQLYVQDFKGFVSNTNTLTIARNGSDTINGVTASQVINSANGGFLFISDGVSNWSAQALGAQATSGVASLNGQTGSVAVVAGAGISVTTAGGNITVANAQSLNSTSSVTGGTATYTSAQNTVLVLRSNSGAAMVDTLPGTSPGILPANTFITVKNNDTAGVLAISAGSGATLKGSLASTGFIYVCPGQSVSFYSDGSNYWSLGQPDTCKLKASTTFYGAASGGSATNNGLTSSSPLNSCAAAYNLAQQAFNMSLLTSAQSVTIQCGTPGVASQTFGATVLTGPIPGQLPLDGQGGVFPVIVQGDTTTPGNITFSVTGGDAFEAMGGAQLLVEGFACTSTPGSGNCIDANGAHIAVKTINFGTSGTNHIASTHRGFVEIVGNYSLTGAGAGEHWLVSDDSSLYVQSATAINYVTNQTWGTAFLAAQYASSIVFNVQPTYVGTGSNTGTQYSIFLNSILNTGHGGVACGSAFPATVIPGTAGACSTGGQIN